MRYVVLDLKGNQRESFDSREELIAELREGLRDDPVILRSLYVLAYDAEGRELGSARRADEVLAEAVRGQPRTVVFDFVNAAVIAVGPAPESDERFQEFVAHHRSAVAGGAH